MATTGAKQRLVALDLEEVSIVDHPANLSDFVVTKGMPADEALGVKQGILKAAWSGAQIDKLADSCFLYIEPGGKKDKEGKTVPRSLRHFPYKNEEGEIDKPHLDNALARIPDSDLPDDVKERCTARAEHMLGQLKHEDKMADKPVAKADDSVQLDPFTASKVTLDAARDLMWRLSDKLGDPSKIADAKAELERIKTMLDKAASFSTLISKTIGDITAEVTQARKDAKDGDPKGKKKVPPFMKEDMKKLLDTVKAMMDEDDEEGDETEKALAVITKAGKAQFSKGRLSKLHEAMKHMASLYKEADPDGYKKAIKDLDDVKPADAQSGGSANEDSPNGTKGPNVDAAKPSTGQTSDSANKGTAGVGAGTGAPQWFDSAIQGLTKSLNDKIDGLAGTVGAVTKRVEAVEATETVSKALNGDGGAKPVAKNKENIWKGVL